MLESFEGRQKGSGCKGGNIFRYKTHYGKADKDFYGRKCSCKSYHAGYQYM